MRPVMTAISSGLAGKRTGHARAALALLPYCRQTRSQAASTTRAHRDPEQGHARPLAGGGTVPLPVAAQAPGVPGGDRSAGGSGLSAGPRSIFARRCAGPAAAEQSTSALRRRYAGASRPSPRAAAASSQTRPASGSDAEGGGNQQREGRRRQPDARQAVRDGWRTRLAEDDRGVRHAHPAAGGPCR